jgi:hypothetical protein
MFLHLVIRGVCCRFRDLVVRASDVSACSAFSTPWCLQFADGNVMIIFRCTCSSPININLHLFFRLAVQCTMYQRFAI